MFTSDVDSPRDIRLGQFGAARPRRSTSLPRRWRPAIVT